MTHPRASRRSSQPLKPQPPYNSPKNLATGYVLSKKEEQLILEKLKSGRCLTSLVAPP